MMTAREARYLSRAKKAQVPAILYLAVPLLFFGTMIELPREPHLIEEAHAAETFDIVEDVPQNDYYCKQIRDKGVKVRGAGAEEVRSLCAREGVAI